MILVAVAAVSVAGIVMCWNIGSMLHNNCIVSTPSQWLPLHTYSIEALLALGSLCYFCLCSSCLYLVAVADEYHVVEFRK